MRWKKSIFVESAFLKTFTVVVTLYDEEEKNEMREYGNEEFYGGGQGQTFTFLQPSNG